MPEALTPRATIGDNQDVDYAQIVTDRLTRDYRQADVYLDDLLKQVDIMPQDVKSDADALQIGALIKNLRDTDTRFEAYREAEKQPYLRSGNAVDAHFHARRDKIARRRKGDRSVKPGAIDNLQERINVWQEQKIAEERARLELERLEAARVAREQAAALRKAQEAAEEAARAAARARSAATQEARQDELAQKNAELQGRSYAEGLAREKAEEARLATLVKPADISRTRGDNGVLLTTAREPYVVLVDRALVDLEVLRPYFTDFEIEKALRGWAKSTGHRTQMAGTEIGFRNKGVTR